MRTSPTHHSSLFGFVLFALGAVFLFGIGLLVGVTVLASLLSGTRVEAGQTVLLVAFVFEAIVLSAAAFFSFQKFLHKPSVDRDVFSSVANWQIAVFVFLAGIALLTGYQLREMTAFDWIFLPILTIPAIVLPLAALLALATRRLPFGTRWQTWNVLGLAMTLTPLILFALEIFIALVIVAGVVAYVLTQPELSLQLQALSRQIMMLGPESEAARDLLAPYLTKPIVIALALLYIAVLVPATEELFKPIGVWLLAGKLKSTAQGLTLGALSGAGYALIETVGVSAQTSDWASLLFSRIGTDLLHVTTSALMGMAIVMAVREQRYLRLFGTYLLAILLHGLWNSLAIFFTFSTFAQGLNQTSRLSTIQPVMVVGMSLLAAVLFMILLISNHRMRNNMTASTEPILLGKEQETSEISQ